MLLQEVKAELATNAYHLETGRTALRVPHEVRALLSAMQLNRPDITPLRGLSDQEWTRLLAFSDIAKLTLQIAQLPTTGFPSWVIEQLRSNVADNAQRFERVKATYQEAAEALEYAGVEHIVIKGFTQSPDYVAHSRLRVQSDIDIFCPPESIDAAYSALQAIGYKPSDAEISYAQADHQVTLVRPGDWQWRGNHFDPEMPLSMELHFCFWNERVSRIHDPGTAPFWERRTARKVEGLSFPCLSPADHLAYFTLHILRNVFLRDWIIHHVRELAVFLHNHADDEFFWENWRETQSPLLRSFAAIAFYYARSWFGCHLHPQAEREVDSLPATRRSWLQCFSGSALELMFHSNKDSVWLHLSFLSKMEKWELLKRTFIPAGIGAIGFVPIQVRNRWLAQPRGSPTWQQYFAYLISRFTAFGRTTFATLGRGLRWRLSEDSLIPKFRKSAR